ncbi:MAG: tetratricopeptide repeat protein [Methylophilaceae bacterium]|nr:tetratricopeptide repeat protein [Methylophilaceae bacterium]
MLNSYLAFFIGIVFYGMAQADERVIPVHHNACAEAIRAGDFSKSLMLAEQQLKRNKFNHDALICKGRVLDQTAHYPQAIATLKIAVKQSATPMKRALALTLIGNIQKRIQNFAEALSTYQKSLAITQAEKETRFERISLNQIGEVQVELGQLAAALESYQAANKLSANAGERNDGYARIAALSSRLGLHEQAIEFQIKVLMAAESSSDFEQYINANLEMGRIYTMAGEYAKAEKILDKTLALTQEQKSQYWEAKTYYYLGLEKVARSELTESRNLMLKARDLSLSIGAQTLLDEINLALKPRE